MYIDLSIYIYIDLPILYLSLYRTVLNAISALIRSIYLYIYVDLSIYLYTYIYLSIYIYIDLSIYIYITIFFYLYTYLCIYLYLGLSKMQHLHREERRVQPHAVRQLQTRVLLDVPRSDTPESVLWIHSF